MKLIKGHYYRCKNDYPDPNGRYTYKKGKIYKSPGEHFLTNEFGENEYWEPSGPPPIIKGIYVYPIEFYFEEKKDYNMNEVVETFSVDNISYDAVKTESGMSGCTLCVFKEKCNDHKFAKLLPGCSPRTRPDHLNVYFKKSEDEVFCTLGSLLICKDTPTYIYAIIKWNGVVRLLNITSNYFWTMKELLVSKLKDKTGTTITKKEFKQILGINNEKRIFIPIDITNFLFSASGFNIEE